MQSGTAQILVYDSRKQYTPEDGNRDAKQSHIERATYAALRSLNSVLRDSRGKEAQERAEGRFQSVASGAWPLVPQLSYRV